MVKQALMDVAAPSEVHDVALFFEGITYKGLVFR